MSIVLNLRNRVELFVGCSAASCSSMMAPLLLLASSKMSTSHKRCVERPVRRVRPQQRESASHCDILGRTVTQCNTLQHTATLRHQRYERAPHCDTLQHTAKLQHTATHLQHLMTHCNTTRTATHSQTAIHCDTLPTPYATTKHNAPNVMSVRHTLEHYDTLQHTATHCNTLQHTATHCNTLQSRRH